MPDFTNSFSHTFQFPASVSYISVLMSQSCIYPDVISLDLCFRSAYGLNLTKSRWFCGFPTPKTISPRGSRNQSMRYHLRPQYSQTLMLLNSSSDY